MSYLPVTMFEIQHAQRSSRPLASSSERTTLCSSFPYSSLQSYRTVLGCRSSCNCLCYTDSSTTVFVIILVTKSPTETNDSSTVYGGLIGPVAVAAASVIVMAVVVVVLVLVVVVVVVEVVIQHNG
ncbi:hypothetical protein HZH68_003804 [Vespula germanica]|uniref:Uncharacterized protein n=1 Tax=Vespula germanica TaxID=30212 RepID=A0A834KMH0_VESGE|nr:hypothetical protein HZH68_003804 [Vespula germanica]